MPKNCALLHRTMLLIAAALLSGFVCASEIVDPRVEALFAPLDRGVQPGAAVLVVKDGRIVHSAGYGYGRLDVLEPITPQSRFRLASVSKQFVAMAVALLAQRGELSLEDYAHVYVPAMKAYPQVTVRQLMNHTSGLPDYYNEIDTSHWAQSGAMPNNQDVIDYVGEMKRPVFTPGERFEYSNPAYEVLPLIVEAVSGMPFSEFMQLQLFRPLGMKDSLIFDLANVEIPHRVYGYSPLDEKQGPPGFADDDWNILNIITGAGGQYSTLEDFYAWDQALYGHELLQPETLSDVFTAATLNDGSRTDYGLGWTVDQYKGHQRVQHGGSWVGFRTHIARLPQLKLTAVVLSNRSDFNPGQYTSEIIDLYLP